jgi:hypothetical protein
MRLQLLVALASAALAAVFGLLNPSVVVEARTVRLLGLSFSIPVVEAALMVAGTALLLVLLLNAVTLLRRSRIRRHLEQELAHREREIVQLKGDAYDRVPELIECLRRELLVKIELSSRALHDDLAGQIGGLRRDLEPEPEPDGAAAIHPRLDASERQAVA